MKSPSSLPWAALILAFSCLALMGGGLLMGGRIHLSSGPIAEGEQTVLEEKANAIASEYQQGEMGSALLREQWTTFWDGIREGLVTTINTVVSALPWVAIPLLFAVGGAIAVTAYILLPGGTLVWIFKRIIRPQVVRNGSVTVAVVPEGTIWSDSETGSTVELPRLRRGPTTPYQLTAEQTAAVALGRALQGSGRSRPDNPERFRMAISFLSNLLPKKQEVGVLLPGEPVIEIK